jgi:hypothetical protein
VKVAVHYHYYFFTPIDSVPGGFNEDHISIDPCSIAILERPRNIDPGDEVGSGDPSC